MAAKGVPSILAGYFNQPGDTGSLGGQVTMPDGTVHELDAGVPQKRPLRDFAEEVKALSDEDKWELVEGVCAVTGDTLPPKPGASA